MQKFLFCFRICLFFCLAGFYGSQVKGQGSTVTSVTQGSVKVNVVQDLQLGSFTQGSTGGTIHILPDGTRMGTGTVVPLNMGALSGPLILEVEGAKGSIVSLLNETVILTGSNGGTMSLKIAETQPPMPFIITEDAPAKSIIKIGAELKVGNVQLSPPGNYSGSLNISFVVE